MIFEKPLCETRSGFGCFTKLKRFQFWKTLKFIDAFDLRGIIIDSH